MPETAVRTHVVVIEPPRLNEMPSVSETPEHMFVQTLVPDPSIQALREAVLSWFARGDIMPFDSGLLCPVKNNATGQLGAVIADNA